MIYCLRVIAAARFMYTHLEGNGYEVGAVPLSHDLGDHVAALMFWGEVSLLPPVNKDNEQSFLAESLADLARDYVLKAKVTPRTLLYGNTAGDIITEDTYQWYVSIMSKQPKGLVKALAWWYRQI